MSRKTLLAVLLVAVFATSAAPAAAEAPAMTVAEVRGAPATSLEAPAAQAPAAPPPVVLVSSWDAQRVDAWARGDLAALAALYTAPSVAGRRDRALQRSWLDRGLRVRGLRTQLLAVRELSRTRSTWRLLVTDRLVGGVATGPGVRRPLPRDEPTTRVVRFRLVAGAWRVAGVRAAAG
jgi:hypothetical protein